MAVGGFEIIFLKIYSDDAGAWEPENSVSMPLYSARAQFALLSFRTS